MRIAGKKLATMREGAILDEALSYQLPDERVWILPDGRLLDDYGEYGNVWSSRPEFLEFVASLSVTKAPADRLSGLESSRPEFTQRIAQMRSRLAMTLAISEADLNYSWKSIGLVDSAMARYPLDDVLLNVRELLDPCIAYVGEVLVRHTGGSWLMLNRGRGYFEPYVCTRDGRRIDVVEPVLVEMEEEYPQGSLEDAALERLGEGRQEA